jgi:hypothetical protein
MDALKTNDIDGFLERLKRDAYHPTLPYLRRGQPGREEWLEEEKALQAQFEEDLANAYDMKNHPKFQACFDLAWDYGHAEGFREVAFHFCRLIELVK